MKRITLYIFFIFSCLFIFSQETVAFMRQAKSWILGYQSEHSLYQSNALECVELHVEAVLGDIFIQGWSLPSVAIEVIKEGVSQTVGDIQLDYKATPERCEIITRPNESAHIASVSYRIMVPRKARVTARTAKGLIQAEDLHGGVSFVSEDGAVTAVSIAGSIFMQASGKVVVSLLSGGSVSEIEINSRRSTVTLCTNGPVNAELFASCIYGPINVQQPVLLLPQQTPLNRQTWDYLQRNVRARMGVGGSRFQIFAHEEIIISLS